MPICLFAPLLVAHLAALSIAASTASPTVTFAQPGPHDVTLEVCNSAGCSSITKTITVLDPLPKITAISGPTALGTAQPPALYTASSTGRPPTFSSWTLTYPDGHQTSTAAATLSLAPTYVGIHTLNFKLTNLSGTAIATSSVSVLPTVFADVPPDHWAATFIHTLYYTGITSGCGTDPASGSPLYCPGSPIARGDLAVFLGRALHPAPFSPPPASGVFHDVAITDPRAPWIEQLFHDGVTTGCQSSPVRLYCPTTSLSRAEMAVLLTVASHVTPPAATGIFGDVPSSYWAARWIEEIFRLGITGGCQTSPVRLFCPSASVSRAEIAVFLSAAFHLSQKPTPTLFAAHLCSATSCTFPAGLPIDFDVHVAGGIPVAYDWDWDGNGTYDQTTLFPTSHIYSSPGTFRPRIRLRLGSYSAVLTHSQAITIQSVSGFLSPPSNVAAQASALRPPQDGDPPGTPVQVAYTVTATSPNPNIRGYAAYVSDGLTYTFTTLLPPQGGTLLLPPSPPGSSARYVSLNAFTTTARSAGSLGARLP
jgi:PKD repeat protein